LKQVISPALLYQAQQHKAGLSFKEALEVSCCQLSELITEIIHNFVRQKQHLLKDFIGIWVCGEALREGLGFESISCILKEECGNFGDERREGFLLVV
jgi:hypothetical protein